MSDTPTDDEWWKDRRVDPLPHAHPSGIELTSLECHCPQCDRVASRMLARHITDHAACIECRTHSACDDCRVRFNTRLRFYGTHFGWMTDSGWRFAQGRSRTRGWLRKAWMWLMNKT